MSMNNNKNKTPEGTTSLGTVLARLKLVEKHRQKNKENNQISDEGQKRAKAMKKEEFTTKEKRPRQQIGHNRANVKIDPQMITLGAEMAAFQIEAGARKFKDFAQYMIEDLGESVKPYLKSFYSSARYYPGMEEYSQEMDADNAVHSFDLETIKPEEDAELEPGHIEQNSPEGKNENAGDGADVPGPSGEGTGTGRKNNKGNREGNKQKPRLFNDAKAEDGINDLGGFAPPDRE